MVTLSRQCYHVPSSAVRADAHCASSPPILSLCKIPILSLLRVIFVIINKNWAYFYSTGHPIFFSLQWEDLGGVHVSPEGGSTEDYGRHQECHQVSPGLTVSSIQRNFLVTKYFKNYESSLRETITALLGTIKRNST